MINHQFWAGKRVFITGHTGFKGGWLTLWLQSMGAKVTGFSLPAPTNPNFFDVVNLQDICDHQIGDIRDYSSFKKAIDKSRPEILFHMAAQSIVRRSYQDPIETYGTNVMGTVHLLEALRTCSSIKSCIIVTTDKCYENKEWSRGYRENDQLGGHDPYSSSKACTELVTSAFMRSFFNDQKEMGLATVRAGNVIGGGDFAEDRIIPDIYRSIVSGQELIIRQPESIRPWQHVLAPLSGYIRLSEMLFNDPKTYSTAFNFGPQESDCISVGDLIEKMSKYWGVTLPVKVQKESSLHEAKFLKLDTSKATTVLGWRPIWSIEKTLEETVRWYKNHLSNSPNRSCSLAQIHDFEKSLNSI